MFVARAAERNAAGCRKRYTEYPANMAPKNRTSVPRNNHIPNTADSRWRSRLVHGSRRASLVIQSCPGGMVRHADEDPALRLRSGNNMVHAQRPEARGNCAWAEESRFAIPVQLRSTDLARPAGR